MGDKDDKDGENAEDNQNLDGCNDSEDDDNDRQMMATTRREFQRRKQR